MRAILLQGARTLLAIVLVYAMLIALALVIYPRPSTSGAVDTAMATRTVFETQAKYLILNRSALRRPGKRVIFIGASNTAAGFPVDQVQPQVRGAIVNNLAVNGSNLTQIRQAFELARMAIAPADRRRTIYVVGLWYGLFVDDAVKWPHPNGSDAETEIDTERYRYGFYRRTLHGPVEVVPDDRINVATLGIYPLIVFEKSMRIITQPVRSRFLGAQPNRTDAERNAYLATPQDKKEKADFWIQSFAGTQISQRQFAALNAIIEAARADHSMVLLVDLPIPAWHSAALPYDARYAGMMKAFLARYHADPGISYVDMRNMRDDTWFSDEVHPKPRIIPLWIAQVTGSINAAVHRLANGEAPS